MKLNKRLLSAIKDYYFNRYRQYNLDYQTFGGQNILVAQRTKFIWNKEADLTAISAAAIPPRKFINFQAYSGTFWFTRKTRKGRLVTYEINENTFPEAIKKENK